MSILKKYILIGTLALSIVLSGTDSFANNEINNIQPIKAETNIGQSLDLRDIKGYYKGNTQMIPLRNVPVEFFSEVLKYDTELKKEEMQHGFIKDISGKDGNKSILAADKSIEIIEKEHKDNKNIKYPKIQGMKGELTEEYVNQGIEGFVNLLRDNEHFEDLKLDYEITFLNDEKMSIVFGGTYKMNRGAEKYFVKSLNLDLKSSNEITFENYFKDDKVSQEKLIGLLDKQAKERGLTGFEAEGRWIKFKGSNVIVFYYPLDDSVIAPVELYLSLEDIQDIINNNFGEHPAS